MSTIQLPSSPVHDERVNDADHPCWMSTFPYEMRRALVDQDLEAGRTVSAVLVTIVTGGLVLGLVGVIAAMVTI